MSTEAKPKSSRPLARPIPMGGGHPSPAPPAARKGEPCVFSPEAAQVLDAAALADISVRVTRARLNLELLLGFTCKWREAHAQGMDPIQIWNESWWMGPFQLEEKLRVILRCLGGDA